MRKKPDAASRIGESGRASMQATRERMRRRFTGQSGVLPPRTYRLPTTTSALFDLNVASSLGTSDGGWLKSASITPRTGADATSNPATTAVPSPSLPDRWTTLTRRVRESSSATSPVPSGELSSTITISRTTPCASQAAKTAFTSSAIRSRSLYVGTTIERSGMVRSADGAGSTPLL